MRAEAGQADREDQRRSEEYVYDLTVEGEHNYFAEGVLVHNCLVVDEAHLLTMEGRGDALECGLMRFTRQNPAARVVLLSATMPNVVDLARWLTVLNGKPSVVIQSRWRPTRLTVNWPPYPARSGSGAYQANENSKRRTAIDLLEQHPDDKWIVFVHSKKAGRQLLKALVERGESAEFHSADLARDGRLTLEERFRHGDLRICIATSTLAYGCYRHGTPVVMGDGTLARIEDVFPGDDVLSLVDGEFRPCEVLATGRKRFDRALRIRLQTGETCDVSEDHVFYGAVGRRAPDWVEAKDLTEGDFLAVPATYAGSTGFVVPQTDDEGAYLTGVVHGDGCLCRVGEYADGSPKIQLDVAAGHVDRGHLDFVQRLLEKWSGQSVPRPSRRSDGVWHLVTKRRGITERLFAEFGGQWDKATMGVPRSVTTHLGSLRSYLRGLFDTDGWVQLHGERNISVGLSSISERLIREVQHHLLRFGVRASVTRHAMRDAVIAGRVQEARRPWSWRVCVYNDQAMLFGKRIGFRLQRKQERLNNWQAPDQSPNSTSDLVPLRGLVDEHLKAHGVSAADFERTTGLRRWDLVKAKDPTRLSAARIAAAFSEHRTTLNDVLDQPVLWKKIRSIEVVEGGLFQDITVADGQNFVGAGIVSHNCNFPARRVLVLGVHRGITEVDPIDVTQMVGRAGRVGLDPEGDAYVLLPLESGRQHKYEGMRRRFSTVSPIESKLNDLDTLAFHLTAEVAEGDVSDELEAVEWHQRSLAAFQGRPIAQDDDLSLSAAQVMRKLEVAGIFARTGFRYEATMLGRVSSWLYFSPFDVSDWCSNFRRLVELDRLRDDDCVAWALGCVKTGFDSYLPREHDRDLGDLTWRLRSKGIERLSLPPTVLAFESLLTGNTYLGLISQVRGLAHDSSRIVQAVNMIDRYVLKALGTPYTDLLSVRLRYGCSWSEAELCRLPGIGAKRAHKLIEAGVKTVDDVLNKTAAVESAIGARLARQAIRGAKSLAVP